jgi:uncharacterized protein YjbI with pentapeptide repeats
MRRSRANSVGMQLHYRVNRLSLSVAVILASALGTIVAAAIIYFGWWLIVRPSAASRIGSTSELFELTKIGFAVTAGLGGLVALVVALRKQRVTEAAHSLASEADRRDSTRLLNDRFVAASNLLGNESAAAVRLAGIYAMASLADDWGDQRQTCIDVLCAYTRLPYDAASAPAGERQVRETIFAVIRDHLGDSGDTSWQGCDFDFSGSTVDGGTLDGIHLYAGRITFAGARFVSGELSFKGALLHSGVIDFSNAQFDGGSVSFESTTFTGSNVTFEEATIAAGSISFQTAQFLDGHVDFKSCRLTGGTVDLTAAKFPVDPSRGIEGLLSFREAELSAGTISFRKVELSGDKTKEPYKDRTHLSRVVFYSAKLLGGSIDFEAAQLHGGHISFESIKMDGAAINFQYGRFGGGTVSFRFATLDKGTINLSYCSSEDESLTRPPSWIVPIMKADKEERAKMYFPDIRPPDGFVDFWDTTLSGAVVDFSRTALNHGTIHFVGCHIRSGQVLFENANLLGTVLNLWRTYFYDDGPAMLFPELGKPIILLDSSSKEAKVDLKDNPYVYRISSVD